MEENNGIVVNLEESREDEDHEIHLSDVFDIDRAVEEHGKKLVVVAGTGAGKSTWVKEVLTQKGRVLFVTSRKIKVKADTEASCFSEVFKWGTEDNQTLITNAKLAYLIRNIVEDTRHDIEEFLNHFDYIVIDEVHSIATDSAFADSCPHVLSFIEYAVEMGKTVVAMTGTLEPMKWYFEDNQWKILDYTQRCRYVHPSEIVIMPLRSLDIVYRRHLHKKKIIYFCNHVKMIPSIIEHLLKSKEFAGRGIKANEIAAIVSRDREQELLKAMEKKVGDVAAEEIKNTSKRTYDGIVKDSLIPDDCNVLVSSSVLKEGIDIWNKDTVMVCENHILTNLIQFSGRVRSEGNTVYVIDGTTDHPVNLQTLIAEYQYTHELKAANGFLTERIMKENNSKEDDEKKAFIKFIEENNSCIYFDYILDKFRYQRAKVLEVKRILKCMDSWQRDLERYCNKYDIDLLSGIDERPLYANMLLKYAQIHIKCFQERIERVQNYLRGAYGIKYKQVKRINEELERLNASIRIISGKETKGINRDKTYWQVVKHNSKELRQGEEPDPMLELMDSQH